MKFITPIILCTLLSVPPAIPKAGAQECIPCAESCFPVVAVKTNMLYDAALTPDFGIELGLVRKFSLSAEGVWAWWSKDAKHRYWRIYGGTLEGRFWFGHHARQRALTGHHIGVYGALHSFDFEFGGTGYQSPELTYGVGVSYGYSIRVSKRMNVDFGLSAGYAGGRLIKYHPECGLYICDRTSFNRYFGITGAHITLVWFPGWNNHNLPDFP